MSPHQYKKVFVIAKGDLQSKTSCLLLQGHSSLCSLLGNVWPIVLNPKAKAEEEAATDPAVVAELQREVEDLKLRLHMAAEHYKEKYKECQRLQKLVLKLSEQQGVGPTRHLPTKLYLSSNKWKNWISLTVWQPITLYIMPSDQIS